jgi:hypothetical protein
VIPENVALKSIASLEKLEIRATYRRGYIGHPDTHHP